ncbi:MAG TPA: hypothetical protein VLE99_00780 [Candidatus Saccharimonadales bacterium]|nr:hypothetical protein [Candidatus Saccharimonadales bacterium]
MITFVGREVPVAHPAEGWPDTEVVVDEIHVPPDEYYLAVAALRACRDCGDKDVGSALDSMRVEPGRFPTMRLGGPAIETPGSRILSYGTYGAKLETELLVAQVSDSAQPVVVKPEERRYDADTITQIAKIVAFGLALLWLTREVDAPPSELIDMQIAPVPPVTS